MQLYCIFEDRGKVPTAWRSLRQAHIPKTDADAAGGPIAAEALRPIAVTSAWYRLWASSRFRTRACARWIDEWWDDDMLGCRRRAEAAEGVAWAPGPVA